MRHRRHAVWGRRTAVGLLAVAAIVAALIAPLATTSGPAGAATIDGARSLDDKVDVQFKKPKGTTTDVHLLAWNDFHGNLEAGAGLNIYGQFAGGAAWLAKAVHDKQAQYGDKQISVIAGDNIGASPLVDGLFFGEPATIATNLMNADFASVGNHEFDKGSAELLRIQNGGCRADVGCTAAPYALAGGGTSNTYPGRRLPVPVGQRRRATTTDRRCSQLSGPRGSRATVARSSRSASSVRFWRRRPTIVTPTGVAGLTFEDEADAANRAVEELQRQRVNTSVLVIHQGGFQAGTATLNGCAGNLAGSDIAEIATRLDPSIKVIVSAHTHAEYRCTITTPDGATRLITSASSFGRILTDITLTIDDKTGELVAASATNSIVRNSTNPRNSAADVPLLDLPKDQRVADVVQQYVTASAPLANQVIGKVSADILNGANTARRDPLGRRDRRCPAGGHAAGQPGRRPDRLHEPRRHPRRGHVRLPLHPIGYRGAGRGHLRRSLHHPAVRQQPRHQDDDRRPDPGPARAAVPRLRRPDHEADPPDLGRLLLRAEPAGADCASRIGNITLNGSPVPDDGTTYRVTMNNFLAGGGDGFTVFNQGTNALGGAQDIDALVAYFGSFLPGVVPNPPVNRIVQTP